jgi:hypothetical protein
LSSINAAFRLYTDDVQKAQVNKGFSGCSGFSMQALLAPGIASLT